VHRDKGAHIGNVDAQTPVAVAVFSQTDGVVKVFGIRRVDGDDGFFGQVRPIADFVGIELFNGLSGLLPAFFVKILRQGKPFHHSADFGIVASGPAEDSNDRPAGRLIVLRIAGDFHHDFVVLTGSTGGDVVKKDGAEKALAFRLNEPEVLPPLQGTDKPVAASLDNLDNLSAVAPLAVSLAAPNDLCLDNIPIHRPVDVVGSNV